MTEVEVIELAVEAARGHDRDRLGALLSPHFFARLANGRILIGESGLVEAVSYSTVVAAPAGPGFADLEHVGGGFVISHETRADSSSLEPGAWLAHVRDRRLAALLYFASPERALDSLPPHLRDVAATEVIQRAIEASNTGDLAALVAMLASDFELRTGADAPVRRGVPALLDLLETIAEHYDRYVLIPDRVHDLGAGLVLVEGTLVTEVGGVVARAPRAVLARVQNGLATGWRLFDTVGEARAAASSAPRRRIGDESG